jgi:uncharacterized membrane protein YebE (DUF533 family)
VSAAQPQQDERRDIGEEDEPAPAANAEEALAADVTEEHRDPLLEIIASKVLNDWLRNRQQLLAPFKIDLQNIEPEQVETLLHAMIVAAQADGTIEGRERERVRNALVELNASEVQLSGLDTALDRPLPLAYALASVKDVRTGANVYAASLLAIDRRKLVNRQYLRYLAARLQLPRDIARALEQRFYAAVD